MVLKLILAAGAATLCCAVNCIHIALAFLAPASGFLALATARVLQRSVRHINVIWFGPKSVRIAF